MKPGSTITDRDVMKAEDTTITDRETRFDTGPICTKPNDIQSPQCNESGLFSKRESSRKIKTEMPLPQIPLNISSDSIRVSKRMSQYSQESRMIQQVA